MRYSNFYNKNRIAPFVVEVQLTNGEGHMTYSADGLDGGGWAVIFTNDSPCYYWAKNTTKYGCDIVIHNQDGSLFPDPSVWVTGIALTIW